MKDLNIGGEYEVLVNDNWEKATLSDINNVRAKFTSFDKKWEWYFTKLDSFIRDINSNKNN